jgi:hypothetical protein
MLVTACQRRRNSRGSGKLAIGAALDIWPDGVVEDELVAVAGKHERHVESARASFGLLEAVTWRARFGLGLDERQRYGLRAGIDAHAKQIVDAARETPGALAVQHDRSGGLLAENQILGPSSETYCRGDQLCAGVGFVKRHTLR